MLDNKKILLVISGGIAAYKTLELIRLLKKDNADVTCILTRAGEEFVTPLSVASLSGNKVYTDLFSLTDETEMGHINLSRQNDLIIVAPASADIMAKMTHGMANDLASTTLLASNKSIMVAPAMNPEMWDNPATQNNVKMLRERGIVFCGPEKGDMACGETGEGRMSEAQTIHQAVHDFFFERPLKGKKVLITSGPTYEPLDPVRFIGNRSSGKQGHAIAKSLLKAGAHVTMISGPTNMPDISGVDIQRIETAHEMLDTTLDALPADIVICAAAVSDWALTSPSAQKMKKKSDDDTPEIKLKQNPDILKTISQMTDNRPALVIGFAAETNDLEENAAAKRARKNCDWLLANQVGKDENGTQRGFGTDENEIYFVTQQEQTRWNNMSKDSVAQRLTDHIIRHFNNK